MRNASEKIFMVEEDYRTINDGLWSPITGSGRKRSPRLAVPISWVRVRRSITQSGLKVTVLNESA
mgnify:CR=1 FL=1